VDGHDRLFVVWVDGFEGFAFYAGYEFIVDEPLQC
jgi:hypothetical protein